MLIEKRMINHIPPPARPDLRNFGLLFGSIVAVLFGLLLPYIFNHSYPIWPWYFLGVFFSCAFILPIILKPIYYGWMFFGLIMSRITTPLLMGLVFFTVVFPMGLVMRLFKSDPLGLRFDPNKETYRIKSDKIDKDNLNKPF